LLVGPANGCMATFTNGLEVSWESRRVQSEKSYF
jgi:hypothetical protein